MRAGSEFEPGDSICMNKIEHLNPTEFQRYRQIRLAALADAPDAFGSTLEREAAFSDQQWIERLGNADVATFVAVDGTMDVGLATGLPHWDDPEEAALVSVWVAPHAREQGVGRALIERVLVWARAAPFRAVRLEVSDHNEPAIRLYERMGFMRTGSISTLPPPRECITEHERRCVL